jgi:hypothetical protein
MSGGSGAQQSSTTATEPWEYQDEHLRKLYREANKLYNQGVPEYYGGTVVAPYSGAETQAIERLKGTTVGQSQGLVDNTLSMANFLSGPAMDPNSNPYLAQYADAATKPLYQNLTEQVLPQIRGQAMGSGMFGSNRQGIAEGLATQRTAQAAGEVTSGIYNEAYGQNLDAMVRNLALVPQTQASLGMPSSFGATAGGAERAYEQALLNEAVNRWVYETAGPYNNLAQFQNYVQGNVGSMVSSQVPGQSGVNPWMGAAGGAMTGAAAGAPLAGATYGLSIPIGALIGGLGGYYASPR